LSDQDKWVFDAIDIGEVQGIGRVLLTVHGEFAECKSCWWRALQRRLSDQYPEQYLRKVFARSRAHSFLLQLPLVLREFAWSASIEASAYML
jgi:hypothetical protein